MVCNYCWSPLTTSLPSIIQIMLEVKWSESCSVFATPWTVAQQAPLSIGILQVRIPEWVAYPFSRGSSWPRNQTRVSCITGRFLTSWATREAHLVSNTNQKGNFWGEFGKIKTGGRVLQQRRKECAENLCRYFPAGPVWLRLWAPVQGAQVQSLVRELEPIRGNEQSTCHSKDPAWCN